MELWKIIPFANLYEVSTLGNIRNKKTKKLKKSPDIKKLKEKQTRIRYSLKTNIKTSKNGLKGFYLHRIVAITFLENPNNNKEVNHKDGNPYNNKLSNVEWCSRKENMNHYNKQQNRPSHIRLVQIINKATNEVEKELKLSDVGKYLNIDISLGYLYKLISQKYESPTCRTPGKKSKTGHIGVTFVKNFNKWKASKFNSETKKYYFQKLFKTEEEAVNYYNTQVSLLPEKKEKEKKYSFDNNKLIINNKIILFKNNTCYGGEDIDENIIWKEFPDNDKYMVSNTGLVKHKRLNRLLKGFNRNGYIQVTLSREDKSHQPMLVHRLVALTFIPNTENKPYVDHIDGGRRNNNLNNLRWATPKENSNNIETKKKMREKGKSIYQLDSNNIIVKEYSGISKIVEYNNWDTFSSSCIYGCIRTYNDTVSPGLQRNLTYKGFLWCYKDDYNVNYIFNKPGNCLKKQIKQINIKTDEETIYDSISDAADKISKKRGCGKNTVQVYLSSVLNKKKIAYDCKWEFIQ